MNVLALLLMLASGPGDFEEDRLPRSLSESYEPPVADPDESGHAVFVGIHFGSAKAIDGKDPAFLAGFEWRIHILPWLAAGGSVDYQAREEIGNHSGVHFLQVPFSWSVLVYPPLPLGAFRPYGQVGIGLTITDISGSPNRDTTDINLLSFAGFGVEIELGPNVLLDASVGYVWAKAPPSVPGFDGDWRQYAVGVLFKLPH